MPFTMNLEKLRIVNPGSVGQPKHGSPMACYALWENGRLSLQSCRYPVEETVQKICALPVPMEIRRQLAAVLRSACFSPDKPTGGEDPHRARRRRRYGRGEQAAI
jgi:protein phosphatase